MRRARQSPSALGKGHPARANSLGLSGTDLVAVLDRLDFGWPAGDQSPRRGYVRWPFRHEFVELRLFHPGATEAHVRTACRNLSRGGVSVLHCAYVHVGTACEVQLPVPGQGAARVRGRVARCDHRGGIVHEVGIAFDHEIDVRQFIPHDPFGDFFALERVDCARLEGRLIVAAESPLDRAIARGALQNSLLRISEAATASGALELARTGCDLVLCDLHMPDATGLELVTELRAQGLLAPVILLAPDLSLMLRRAIGDLAVDAVLAKPVSASLLRRAVGEFLLIRPSAGANPARAARSDPGALQAGAQALADLSHELEGAARAGDQAGIRAACLRIAGSGALPEFAAVRVLALQAARALDRGSGLADALAPLRALVRASRAPRLRGAA